MIEIEDFKSRHGGGTVDVSTEDEVHAALLRGGIINLTADVEVKTPFVVSAPTWLDGRNRVLTFIGCLDMFTIDAEFIIRDVAMLQRREKD